ncbi:hypothetical protein M413DRAFT_12350 [Hebeloma cylindrosporum]|uniref:Uncharacterized protein n=1 Tax=Hebeloma cylindrosporum TaxID=76867 RepID=A0A0C3C407_HEBCY|nr:hypothetical protein M413DRAFT_12350 [Hebeloma cylindrosporum h7]
MTTLPDYSNDPTSSITENFRRLAIQEGWTKKSQTYKKERKAFIAEAVETGFTSHFGVNASSLQAWQSLCGTIGIENMEGLTSIKRCKKAMSGIYVNLVDLVDARTAGTKVSKTFSSPTGLAKYIRKTKKTFPKERAKKSPMLRQFLIVVGGN